MRFGFLADAAESVRETGGKHLLAGDLGGVGGFHAGEPGKGVFLARLERLN